MVNPRTVRPFTSALMLCCLIGLVLPACAATKIGLFPLRPAAGLQTDLNTEVVLPSLTDGLLRELQEAGIGEIVLLPWPEALAAEDRPTFETLVGRGKEAGCNGVLALQVTSLGFSLKQLKLPLVGTVAMADANVGVAGGLVDVATTTAVGPVDAAGKSSEKNYRGPAPKAVAEDATKLDGSLLGKAMGELRKQVVAAVKAGAPRLTAGEAALPPRAGAPQGVGFSQDSYAMDITTGYDQRSTVAVVNRGNAPEAFVIRPLEQAKGIVVGLVGQGSTDGPFTLGPGQWKYTRLEVHCYGQPERQAVPVRLGLYAAAAGAAPDQAGEPRDKAVLNLSLATGDEPTPIKLSITGQDPVTLAYTCSIVNMGGKPANLSLALAPEQLPLVSTAPALGRMFAVPAQGSLTFQAIPHFPERVRQMDVALGFPQQRGWVASGAKASGGADTLKLHFEVPAGKHLYTALSSTCQSFGGEASGCTNQGDLELAGSKNPAGSNKGTSKADDGWDWRQWVKDKLGLDMDKWGEDESTTPPPTRPRGRDGCPPGWHKDPDSGKCQPPSFGAPGSSGLRGAVVRPKVAARLPGLENDTTIQPSLVIGKKRRGAVLHTPAADGKVAVFFGVSAERAGGDPGLEMLSDSGHTARWPSASADYPTSRAFVVWEDATDRGTDVAFRASGEGMANWRPVTYLTQHAAGVMDPVVRTSTGNVVMVAWEDLRAGEPAARLYTRVSRDGGKTFGAETPLPQAPGEQQSWPQLDANSEGTFALVYVSKAGGQSRILSTSLDAAGKPTAEPVALSNPGVPCGEPQIACDGEGGKHAVWREGEDNASEAWFATSPSPGAPWSAPRRVTQDAAYSEYPLVGLGGDGLWVRYHSDISGVADMAYVVTSADRGATWGEAVMLPTLQSAIEHAWVEVNFALQWPDQAYAPHDTQVLVNGVEVGRITGRVPQGTYVFEVPSRLVRESADRGLDDNSVMTRPTNLNGAHYIRAQKARLVVKRRFTQVQVAAASQAEADQLAKHAGVNLNHDRPDLALGANGMAALPLELRAGTSVDLALQVQNLGEASATETRVALYSADPRVPSADLGKAKLAEQMVGSVAPGQTQEARLAFRFDPKRTGRVWAAVQSKEPDFQPADNCWILSFTQGESAAPTPLLGTDIPNVFQAPSLMGMVQLPNVPALADLISLPDFGNWASVPGMQPPNIRSIGDILKSQLTRPDINLPNLGGAIGLP